MLLCRKGKEIKPSNKYIIKSEGTVHKLIIKKATTDDQAEITCTAANVKTSSKLKIESEFLYFTVAVVEYGLWILTNQSNTNIGVIWKNMFFLLLLKFEYLLQT